MAKPLRVVDLTNGWAGPMATCLLADFGAEVIKVESPSHMDWWRGAAPAIGKDAGKPYEQSPTFNTVNRNKLGIALELTHPHGRRLFYDLVGVSDVLIANYPPRSLRKLAVDFDALKIANPGLVMVTLPAFGNTGPESEYVGFGTTTEAMAGITGVTGYADGPPQMLSNAIGDPVSALNACFAALVGSFEKERRGAGVSIDLSHVEGLLPLNAFALLDYTLNGRSTRRLGNRHGVHAPHGCYRCKGDDEWVALAVTTDGEWKAFRRALGCPKWAMADELDTVLARKEAEDELDQRIGEWTAEQAADSVMQVLQAEGIAAAVLLSGASVLSDEHLAAREFFLTIDKEETGPHLYPGFVPRFADSPSTVRRPAPSFGKHNDYVFGKVLGLTEQELQQLKDENIISTEPILPSSGK